MRARSLLSLMFLTVFIPPALAADLEPPAAPLEEGWRFQATLYGWAAGITGDVGVLGLPPVHVDVTPIEALRHLDGALMGAFLAKNGDWSLLGDLMWVSISANETGPAGGTVDFKLKQLTASGLIGYRLPVDVPNLDLSATVGARYQHLKAELDVNSSPLVFSGEGTKQWIDPTIGLLMHYDINDRWFINGLADIGGFGVSSKITAQGFATIGYNWSSSISTAIGYRAIYTDYQKGGFVFNTTEHGIFTSLGYHF